MRFHVLGLPHTVTSKEFNACAYTQKVVKFGKMMKARGHEIIHYGHEESDLICDEHVTVITNEDWKMTYGDHDWRKTFFKFDQNDHAYQTFYKNAITEIDKRKQPNDFLLPFWGSGVRPICDAHEHDMIVVEPGIGYGWGHWARWKIFESYAIYHAYGGMKNVAQCNQDWYEVVIPNYFDLEDFIYSAEKENYFLYLGRVFDGKGVNIAIEATKLAGVKLVIAGQKEEGYNLPDHVEYIGYADVETRKRLMSKAKASFLASMYIEPFGGVQIENLLSGTPTITTDWGSFAENNLHGITGYRCRTMGDFVQAIHNIDNINPADCRKFGENFSLEKVAPMYEKYFQDVLDIYIGKGWYTEKTNTVLNSLEKKYPNRESNINLIPNILHMIWVGNAPIPEYFYTNLAKWKKLMPDWEFKIWTNEEVKNNITDLSYLELLNKTRNGAQKTDLLRYYVVNKFGGYYVDADIEPQRSLVELNIENNNFVICHDLEITWEFLQCAFFAATANNPILQHAIEQMYNVDYTDKEQQLTTGPGALGRAYFAAKEKVDTLILPYWYFYRNKKGDIDLNGTHLNEDKKGIFGSHRYEGTWCKEDQKPPIEWYYFYTPEYEEWHKHLQSRLEPTFKTIPIKIDKIDIHNQHPFHHFTGSVDRIKIVIDVIKKNLGKKIVFSDVTWVINKDGVNELKEIIDNCKETTYAQNDSQTEHINMGLICMYCSLDELELWSYCLGQLECDPNLHEQYVLDKRLKHKPMFNPQKIKARWIESAEQFEGYLALKIFTPSHADHTTRYNHRIETIKRFNLEF